MGALKVLLVDDEQEFVDTLSERLRMRDIRATSALDGNEALAAVRDAEPDVIVLDLRMPGMDGMEVLHQMKRAFPSVRVVMLTGHGTKQDEERANHLGADAYLQKPVDLERLVATLREISRDKRGEKIGSSMMAATFAAAREVEAARRILRRREGPLDTPKRKDGNRNEMEPSPA